MVIETGSAATVTVKLFDPRWAGDAASTALTVKLVVVAVGLGVPLITPLVAFSERPAGSEPLETDQV
ncbi:unannotated protein [freshwater metagenome]|uniref:Unannotated protein n=1 Tax=freshwater metagenome TaxID=449393 RepID=A0A6J7NIP5_9ZZZZ